MSTARFSQSLYGTFVQTRKRSLLMSRCPAWDWEVPFLQRFSADRTCGLACREQAVSQHLLQLPLIQSFVQCGRWTATHEGLSVALCSCAAGTGEESVFVRVGASPCPLHHIRGELSSRLYYIRLC